MKNFLDTAASLASITAAAAITGAVFVGVYAISPLLAVATFPVAAPLLFSQIFFKYFC